jgi:hypothetical protein
VSAQKRVVNQIFDVDAGALNPNREIDGEGDVSPIELLERVHVARPDERHERCVVEIRSRAASRRRRAVFRHDEAKLGRTRGHRHRVYDAGLRIFGSADKNRRQPGGSEPHDALGVSRFGRVVHLSCTPEPAVRLGGRILMKLRTLLVLVPFAALAAACGGEAPPADSPAGAASEEAPAAESAPAADEAAPADSAAAPADSAAAPAAE